MLMHDDKAIAMSYSVMVQLTTMRANGLFFDKFVNFYPLFLLRNS